MSLVVEKTNGITTNAASAEVQASSFAQIKANATSGILHMVVYDMSAPANARKLGHAVVKLKDLPLGEWFNFYEMIIGSLPHPDMSEDLDKLIIGWPYDFSRQFQAEITISGGGLDCELRMTNIYTITGDGHIHFTWDSTSIDV